METYNPPAPVKMDEEQDQVVEFPVKRLNNTLPIFGNKDTMNINSMILTNIHQSRYFKTELIELKTFHAVIDEIYYKVNHLEPWERNSRKLAGQVGMCAGVRGVASGGIVSTPFCLLFKLFTMRLTRKQVTVMLNHSDSPYIRGLGFMYIRYCQPPKDFLGWFNDYFDDEEEIDLKAGGGFKTTIGGMCRMMLTKMEWFGTMFPRIPVSVQKEVKDKMDQLNAAEREKEIGLEMESPSNGERRLDQGRSSPDGGTNKHRSRSRSSERRRRSRSPDRRRRSRSPDRRRRSKSPDRRHRSRSPDRRRRSRSPDRRRRSRSPDRRRRSRSPDRKRRGSRSPDRKRRSSRSPDRRRRSRSPDRKRRSSSPDRRHRSRSPRRRSKERRHRSRSRDRRRSNDRHSKRSKSRSRSPRSRR